MMILLDSRKNLEESQTRRNHMTEVAIYGEFLTTSCKYYAFNFAILASLSRIIIYIAQYLVAAVYDEIVLAPVSSL